MKVYEYEGLTEQEAWRTRRPGCLGDLQPTEGIPAALIDLAPGAKRPSAADLDELRRFAGYLRLKADGHLNRAAEAAGPDLDTVADTSPANPLKSHD